MFTSTVHAQQEKGSPLFTYIYLESGDVYIGRITQENDSALTIREFNLGEVVLLRKEVQKTEHFFRNDDVQLSLSDHSKYSGELLDVTTDDYLLATESAGNVRILKTRVVGITRSIDQRIPYSPNCTRYFFAPSAIPIEKKGGYYQNAYLLANSVNFGVTDNFTIGGGVVIPLLFFITPKIGVKVSDHFYIGAGLLGATTLIPDAIISGGIPFAVATVGNKENNVTIGAGYGLMWNEGEFEHTHYPIITLNGMVRISDRVQLVTENWIIPFKRTTDEDGYYDSNNNWVEAAVEKTETKLYMALSAGARIMVGKRSTVDFAPVYLYGGDQGVVVPYLDFVYKF
jgi:hypothetical protein